MTHTFNPGLRLMEIYFGFSLILFPVDGNGTLVFSGSIMSAKICSSFCLLSVSSKCSIGIDTSRDWFKDVFRDLCTGPKSSFERFSWLQHDLRSFIGIQHDFENLTQWTSFEVMRSMELQNIEQNHRNLIHCDHLSQGGLHTLFSFLNTYIA